MTFLPATNRRQLVAACLAALALSACGGPAPATFDLSALGGAGGGGGRGQLVVSAPVATAALDSDRILIRPQPDQVAYLTGAQWADRLPALVQTRIVQSLENGRMLAAVGRTGSGMTGDWAMAGEVRRFEIDVASGQAIVEITVKLLSNTSGRVVGAFVARGAAPGSTASGESATRALDAAFAQALEQIVRFVRARV